MDTKEEYNELFTITQMGEESIQSLMKVNKENDFQKYLLGLKELYYTHEQTIKQYIENSGEEEKGLNGFEKIRTDFMINMQTLSDTSISHLAEMMIVGTIMGIIKTIRLIHNSHDDTLKELANDVLAMEETSLEELKVYL